MNILVIGNGGREHALAYKLSQSNKVSQVFVAPGNAGTALESKITNINISKIDELIDFVKNNSIEFTVVGPEAPLALGIVDQFRANGLKIWGPTQFCAQLESSKAFAKEFMQANHIPTAKYQVFTDLAKASKYLEAQSFPIVIKADGLASGKGVLVAESLHEALKFIQEIFLENKFGNDAKVVIEEFIDGIEASFIVMIDGKNIAAMATSQDHKRLLDDDLGPNTGGMGAYSPAPIVTPEIHQKVIDQVITPVVTGMNKLGHSYSGFLYAGLMIDKNQNIYTLEFNCRFGDPETQPIMLRLESDLVELIEAGFEHKLDQVTIKWNPDFAICVVLASNGYPDSPKIGDIIHGLDSKFPNQIKVYHSGTKMIGGNICSNGGRVLGVTALGHDLAMAKHNAYAAIKLINFNGMQYRHDIGDKELIK